MIDNNIIKQLSYLIIEHDKKINETQHMLYSCFSYLYNRIDGLNTNIGDELNNISDNLASSETIINDNENTNTDYNLEENNNTVINKIKRKRPLFYFITKYFIYKKRLKEKLQLEKTINEKNAIIKAYKEEQDKIKKQEELKHNKKLQKTRESISNILRNNMYKS